MNDLTHDEWLHHWTDPASDDEIRKWEAHARYAMEHDYVRNVRMDDVYPESRGILRLTAALAVAQEREAMVREAWAYFGENYTEEPWSKEADKRSDKARANLDAAIAALAATPPPADPMRHPQPAVSHAHDAMNKGEGEALAAAVPGGVREQAEQRVIAAARAYLDHFDTCEECMDEGGCEEGFRLHGDLREAMDALPTAPPAGTEDTAPVPPKKP